MWAVGVGSYLASSSWCGACETRRRRGGSRLCVPGGTIGEESGAVTCSRHGRLSAVTYCSQSPDAAKDCSPAALIGRPAHSRAFPGNCCWCCGANAPVITALYALPCAHSVPPFVSSALRAAPRLPAQICISLHPAVSHKMTFPNGAHAAICGSQ